MASIGWRPPLACEATCASIHRLSKQCVYYRRPLPQGAAGLLDVSAKQAPQLVVGNERASTEADDGNVTFADQLPEKCLRNTKSSRRFSNGQCVSPAIFGFNIVHLQPPW